VKASRSRIYPEHVAAAMQQSDEHCGSDSRQRAAAAFSTSASTSISLAGHEITCFVGVQRWGWEQNDDDEPCEVWDSNITVVDHCSTVPTRRTSTCQDVTPTLPFPTPARHCPRDGGVYRVQLWPSLASQLVAARPIVRTSGAV
jgi:hypothetical protein